MKAMTVTIQGPVELTEQQQESLTYAIEDEVRRVLEEEMDVETAHVSVQAMFVGEVMR